MNLLLEYVWLDGYRTANLRSKLKVLANHPSNFNISGDLNVENLPIWNFDGSSTSQAPGDSSECLLKPVRSYVWNRENNHYLILCEVMNSDGTPHKTNTRTQLSKLQKNASVNEYWWGFEQEYFITENFQPLGFPRHGYPKPQGLYYCGVGGNQVKGRNFVEAHLRKCLSMGIELTGINAEVAVGQWEYQCFSKDTLKACDDLWITRYVLYRMSEEYGWDVDITPKPVKGDWNGSGCHTNFSTVFMRDEGGQKYFENILDMFFQRHNTHILKYGENNDQRLTGDHETQHINTFTWGVANRGASIRVPTFTADNQWKGYLEDRRPASNCDPYNVATLIIDTVTMANV